MRESGGSQAERRGSASSEEVSSQERALGMMFALGALMERRREGYKDLHCVLYIERKLMAAREEKSCDIV